MNTLIVIDKKDLSEQLAISLYNQLGTINVNILTLAIILTEEIEDRARDEALARFERGM